MSLRSKIVIILSAVVLGYAGLDHVIQRWLVLNSFVALEKDGAQHDVDRIEHAIATDIGQLERDCMALATSNDCYRFAADGSNKDFVERSLNEASLRDRDIDLVYICDLQGRAAFVTCRDWKGLSVGLTEFPDDKLPSAHPLLLRGDAAGERPAGISGTFTTERGVLLVASAPIVGVGTGASGPNDGSGQDTNRASLNPQRGTIILGRFVDTNLVEQMSSRTGVRFDLWALNDSRLPQDARDVLDRVATEKVVTREVDEEHLAAYAIHRDINGVPCLAIRANLTRDVTQRGNSAVRYALVSTIAAGLLLMLVLLNLLQRTVLQPLAQLTEHAVEIGHSEDFTKRIKSDRTDEVGILANEFDGMIEKVAQSRAALVETARAAGMSEIATGVLHNIGNVLNSVNVSANLAANQARSSASADLKRVMDTLRDVADDLGKFISTDPRGKHVYPLLDSLAQKLVDEQSRMVAEIDNLNEGIDHIKELVQAQQGYAGRAGVREVLVLADQIDSALSITSQTGSGDGQVEIVRQYGNVPSIAVDRHRLMEILVNLIQNARQSVAEAGSPDARIAVRVTRPAEETMCIEVIDNGVGIPAENLSRIFNHGFTTKQKGHGFGLHASANAATEMGARLSGHSDGPGKGATFRLEIPLTTGASVGATT